MVAAIIGLPLSAFGAQHHPEMPAGKTHDHHPAQATKDADLKRHGQMAMGFDQDKATHHFTLTTNGGVIAVTANDAADEATRDQIRVHLQEIGQ
jgi:hypothetical protein